MPVVSIGPHRFYHFGYALFWSLLDLITEVNSFDDFNKSGHFLLNQLRMLHKLFTHYIFVHQ